VLGTEEILVLPTGRSPLAVKIVALGRSDFYIRFFDGDKRKVSSFEI